MGYPIIDQMKETIWSQNHDIDDLRKQIREIKEGNLRGPPGPSGKKGEIGNQGFPGQPGNNGINGTPGTNGIPGTPGSKGDQGIGLTGPKGPPGLIGPKGEKGLKGDTGSTGRTGSRGAIGPKGHKGDIGMKGNLGAKGSKGDVGQTAIDCAWGTWSEWGSCSKSCGDGMKTRTRAKIVIEQGSGVCNGRSTDSDSCHLRACPLAYPCNDFSGGGRNDTNYDKYCFVSEITDEEFCIGQHDLGYVNCSDIHNGIQFVFDKSRTWPMRFNRGGETNCQNYHPGYLQNLASALGYENYQINVAD